MTNLFNHLGDIAQMIVALVAVASFLKTWHIGIKQDRISVEQTEIKHNVALIEQSTNSMRTAMVASARKEGIDAGLAQGRGEAINAKEP